MLKLVPVLLLSAAISSCTWVGVAVEGENVRLAQASEVGDCSRLGRTRSKTLNKIVGIGRGADKLQEELVVLARNEGGVMGGNVIVAESLIEEGEQSFGVYSCPS